MADITLYLGVPKTVTFQSPGGDDLPVIDSIFYEGVQPQLFVPTMAGGAVTLNPVALPPTPANTCDLLVSILGVSKRFSVAVVAFADFDIA